MSQALHLMDKALDLARQELSALRGGAYERAVELATQRGEMTNMAWSHLESSSFAEYKARLRELERYQAQLTEIATAARDRIRAGLNQSRQEKKRMRGYHQAVSYALQ